MCAGFRATLRYFRCGDDLPRNHAGNGTELNGTSVRGRLDRLQALICFGNDLIDHGFHVLGAFPHHELSIGAGAFAYDALDAPNLALVAEFLDFSGNKLEHLMQQIALIHFAAPAEIDQLAIETVARRAPSIFINQTPRITAKCYIVPTKFL